ncbi:MULTISPECIES: enoyl-CoA hydratase/isomerase family protein [unclassified Moraxella]|uniref:enoyl-CoA hydratase/isomerase family protein n=1 Tax=unclassified Moraxella TaxID=2685852 RepID=UPI003AF50C3E
MENMESPVLFDTIQTTSGHQIGTMTLNDPKALNALSVDMCKLMATQLTEWASDESIVTVILKGSGDKAFCAGGNIRKLYDSMTDNPTQIPLQQPNAYAVEFFENEYSLYRQMHFYQKPIILWGNGIVMGGGMGLMAMCSHRVVTETTRFAMPEITIGLYPDATGSWFLARMPAKVGLFLGLTGANCNAKDAIFTSLAEYAVASDEYEKVINALVNANWQANCSSLKSTDSHSQDNVNLQDIASQALASVHHVEHLADSNLMTHFDRIQAVVNQGSVHDMDKALRNDNFSKVNGDTDKWLSRAVDTYTHGCPVSAGLTFEIFERASKLSLEQVLYMEMNASLHCANYPDFREGVRALLIDKDKSPKWSKTLDECDTSYIISHLQTAFPNGEHPFEDWLSDKSLSSQLAKG